MKTKSLSGTMKLVQMQDGISIIDNERMIDGVLHYDSVIQIDWKTFDAMKTFELECCMADNAIPKDAA